MSISKKGPFIPMQARNQSHLVVVEAYQGSLEFLSDQEEELKSSMCLGLPLAEMAEILNCRVTVLCWDHWYTHESREIRVTTPATRPILDSIPCRQLSFPNSSRVKRVAVAPLDPEYGLSFDKRGFSPRSHGLINDNGFLFFVSCCLRNELCMLYNADPFQTVILPMWGGIGYVSQLARATRSRCSINIPFTVVVTDISANREISNQEGRWIRQNIVRRQMEDMSLALADLVLVFGPRGHQIAISGRLPEASPTVMVPRFIEADTLDEIERLSSHGAKCREPVQFFLYEPQEGASGVLATLDAINCLINRGVRLDRPVVCAGSPMVFPPMKPRSFNDYWASRGAVRRLLREAQWQWQREYPKFDGTFSVRLYPSSFEHLPNVWSELARGSLVVLSRAAAEGLAPGEILPGDILIPGDPDPENVAATLEAISKKPVSELDRIRRELCSRVIEAHRGHKRERLLLEATAALGRLIHSITVPQDLSRVSLLLLDRRVSLRSLAEKDKPLSLPEPIGGVKEGSLSVVVTCHEMGSMIADAIKSVWNSRYLPDEVLLIDDGSLGEETLRSIETLEALAYRQSLPLRIIRQENKGLPAARNVGLAEAGCEFISFLDGDDIIEADFYETALPLLKEHPRLGGVAAWASIFGSYDGLWNAPQPELPLLFVENTVIVPCLMRTELLRQLGGYDVRQRYNYEDWELSIRMLLSGWPIVTIPACLLRYRIRESSMYRTMTDVQDQVMQETLFEKHREAVSDFAVGIAMQLEHRYMELACTSNNDDEIKRRSEIIFALQKRPLRFLKKCFHHLLSKRRRI